MREHPNAAVVRRWYEAHARAVAAATVMLTPLALAAAGGLVVAIEQMCDRATGDSIGGTGVAVFRVSSGRITESWRLPQTGEGEIVATRAAPQSARVMGNQRELLCADSGEVCDLSK